MLQAAVVTERQHLKVWKSLLLPVYPNQRALMQDLERHGVFPSRFPDVHCLERIPLLKEGLSCNVAKVTPRELGFLQEVPLDVFFRRAFESGLGLCHPQVAPEVIKGWKENQRHEHLRVGMRRLFHKKGRIRYVLRNDVTPEIWGSYMKSEMPRNILEEWLFTIKN